ncbi:MAG: HDIG domain-containing protein [Bacteroidota bacterium]|nr:HDIG domain-containing protein [Bacteroidota bacterium]MDP4234439.1 HDIG domain-containing protein [Bacteroidota bacterium]MDP4244005.1 HDIG domain-containing protein [Bacteroidota bacterium]MDP4288171.1 HDIG domain-containing protein [Bacteroidota bacterium]
MRDWAKQIILNLREAAARPGWRRSKVVRWTIGVVLTLIIAALFPSAQQMALTGYSVGSPWMGEDEHAPFSFPVYKDVVRYRQDVRKALDELYPVYVPDTLAREETLSQLHASYSKLIALVALVRKDSLDASSFADSAKPLGLTSDDCSGLVAAVQKDGRIAHKLEDFEAPFASVVADLELSSLITQGTREEASASTSHLISLRYAPRTHPNAETVLPRDSLLTVEAATNRVFSKLEILLKRNNQLVAPLSRIAATALRPNVTFDATLTDESRSAIIDRVPRTDGIVVEGQRIISKGEIISPPAKSALESLAQAQIDRGGTMSAIGRIAGTIGHVGLIVLLLVLYLKFIRRRIYKDNGQLLLMALVLLFPAILAYLSVRVQVDFPLQYFILIPVASMLLTVLFDSRTGFYGTVIAALLVAGIRGNDYEIALAGLCAGAFAAYTVRDLRNRAQLFTSIAYIFIGYLIAITALSLEQATSFGLFGYELIAALGNSLISPVITLVVLFAIESVFDTVSDLRLSEFDNINHPLLRELALRAPGTYQHTMQVAQLAENAALAIGSNPLLARVGALFHDVGKLTDPVSFVENQSGENGNIHESISPRESADRVRNHVAQGIELARAHRLPQRIIDFIPMHHGTLPISFFYQRALNEATGGGEVNEDDFRYGGPIPNSKETAILMLADASEAIARTLAASGEETTPEAIEAAVTQLVRTRFDQGQLDRCDITAHDLTIIRGVFARLLAGLHHARVQYPSLVTPGATPSPGESAHEPTASLVAS